MLFVPLVTCIVVMYPPSLSVCTATLWVYGWVCPDPSCTQSDVGPHASWLSGTPLQATVLWPGTQPRWATTTWPQSWEEAGRHHWLYERTHLGQQILIWVNIMMGNSSLLWFIVYIFRIVIRFFFSVSLHNGDYTIQVCPLSFIKWTTVNPLKLHWIVRRRDWVDTCTLYDCVVACTHLSETWSVVE